VDLNTRRLRYLLALADELHFGRAAARFFIAQQAMSRQIRDLERDLGVTLFERTTRSVSLTPEGAAFAEAAREVLAALDTGVDAARALGRTTAGVVNVGFRLGAALELTEPILESLARTHPQIEVALHELDFREPWRTFADGQMDLAIIRAPFRHAELRFAPLFTEPLVAALSHRHPLAAQASVSVDELRSETIVVADSTDPTWHSYWSLEAHFGGPPKRLAHTTSLTEELELVAAGVACSITVAAAARYMPRPGVSYVPITGVPPCTTGLAWNPETVSPPARQFIEMAIEVRDREIELVAYIEDPFGKVPVAGTL
jgi:DNA-binding transcriptional LysR family regulator